MNTVVGNLNISLWFLALNKASLETPKDSQSLLYYQVVSNDRYI